MVRVGLFDDHEFFTSGLAGFLEQHAHRISIVFKASTREQLETELKKKLPDVLVSDVLAPDVQGLELFISLARQYSALKMVAYTSLRSPLLLENLLAIGVKGYVSKNQKPEDLLQTITAVYHDHTMVPPEYAYLLPATTGKKIKYVFTGRELQLLKLIAKGATVKDIAQSLDISTRTIENLKVNLFEKTGAKNSAELVLLATQMGYL